MAHDLLLGYGAATAESAAAGPDGGRLLAELETFSTALTESEPLRRILTDPAVAPVARRGIAADLLHDRATSEGAALVDFAVRVVRATELPTALADLRAVIATRVAGDIEMPTSGRTARRARIRGYAERVLEELAGLPEIDEVEEELFGFARLLDANPPLRQVLADASAPVTGRQAVIRDLVGSRVKAPTLRLIDYVITAGQLRDLVGTYEWLVELTAEERGRRVAKVQAAVDLSEDERGELKRVLSRLVHRDVEVRVIEDPSVIGGVLVSVGDLLVDGTIRLRFERLREAVAQWA